MNHTNVSGFRLTNFVPGDESGNAWTAIITSGEGEQSLLSFSLEVATQMFGQLRAALQQCAKEGNPVEIPSVPERVTGCNADLVQSADGEAVVDILLVGDQSPRAFHGVLQKTEAKTFAALLQAAAERSGPTRAN